MSARLSEFTIMMTASVTPKKGLREALRRSDPSQRLGEYQGALEFWLSLSEPRIKGIVFAENTGYPLDSLREPVRLAAGLTPEKFLEDAARARH